MMSMKLTIGLLTVVISLIIKVIPVSAQEIPCRQWYYKKDRYGAEIKTSCQEAWQVNSNGQKHGKYIEYYENGNPSAVAMYRNGVLHGSYTSFYADGVAVWDKGNYVNGKKDGFWKEAKNSGTYKDGSTIGVWKFGMEAGNIDINFDTKEMVYHWNNLVLKSKVINESISGELLFQFIFEKGDFGNYITDRPNSVKINVNEEAVYSPAPVSSFFLSKDWSLENKDDLINSASDTNYNFKISRVELNRLIQKLKGNDGTPKNAFMVLPFVNGNLDSSRDFKIFNETGSLLGTMNFGESVRQEESLLKKRDMFLDSIQSVLSTYAKDGKLIYSSAGASSAESRLDEIFRGLKSRKPGLFNEYYKASIDQELKDRSMLSLNPARYSGLIKVDRNVLNIMQAFGMKLTEETISRDYYLDYTIADGKFDGVQRIGSWSQNMVTPKEGRVHADYIYEYTKGIKKTYKDVNNHREFAFNDKGEPLDYQTLFYGIREIYEGLDGVTDYEFKKYANDLFNRYKEMNAPEWAKDTVYFYALNYSNRSNDIKALNKFYEEAKNENVNRKYYQDYEWKIFLAKNQLNEALNSITEALESSSNEKDVSLNYNKALIQTVLGKSDEAIRTLETIRSGRNYL
jgi:hypothetical protein